MADETKLRYTVEIGKTGTGAKDAAKDLEQVSKAAESSQKSLVAMGREFKAAVVAFTGMQVVRESIRAFSEHEAAVQRLNGTLAATGRTGAATGAELQKLAQQLILPPGATQNGVLDAMSELLRNGAGMSQLPRLTQQVLNLAAAGIGLEQAADAMGNAIAGDFGKIARLTNVDFPAAAGRANNFAAALDAVDEKFKGMAKMASESQMGEVSKAKDAWNESLAIAGEMGLRIASPFLQGIQGGLKRLNARLTPPELKPEDDFRTPSAARQAELDAAQRKRDAWGPATAARELNRAQVEAQMLAMRMELPLPRTTFSPNQPADLARTGLATKIASLEEAGTLKKGEAAQAMEEVVKQHDLAMLQIARSGRDVAEQSFAAARGLAAQETLAIKNDYAERKESVLAYYGYRLTLATQDGQDQTQLYQEQARALQNLTQQERIATFAATYLGKELQQVGQQGVQAFASGVSSAFVQAFRTGRLEFRQFAAEFLGQIAQMIMQALVLATIKRALSGTSVGSFLGFAQGGFAPRYAAAGALMGTQQVSTATYFPKFNAVAGEAGSEIMAVLSRPRFMQIGGLQSYVGSVQGSELAMTNARDLRAAVGGAGKMGGEIVITVRGTKDFEARITDNSIEGALVRVHNEVLQDTGLRSAIKEVGA